MGITRGNGEDPCQHRPVHPLAGRWDDTRNVLSWWKGGRMDTLWFGKVLQDLLWQRLMSRIDSNGVKRALPDRRRDRVR